MLWTPTNSWNFSVSGTQISVADGAQNAKGSWVEVLPSSSVTSDVYWIDIAIGSIGSSTASSRSCLVDIGIDEANTSNFTVLIPNLICGNAGDRAGDLAGPVCYAFPLFIKSGTQIGARSQTNNAGAVTPSIIVKAYGKPTKPELVPKGRYVTAFGINTATTQGTSVTPGALAVEGSYVDISAADFTLDYFYWEYGLQSDDGSMQSSSYVTDIAIGDASNKQVVILDHRLFSTSTERIHKPNLNPVDGWYYAKAGATRAYARTIHEVATPDSNVTMGIYGVGG